MDLTDFNPSDFGIVLLELLAFMGDNVHYYIDRMAAESFLPTALTRRSVVNLLKLIDYELRARVAATVDLQFTLGSPLAEDLIIPNRTLCKTICDRLGSQVDELANNIFFETTSQLTIPAGALVGTVGGVQGVTRQDVEIGESNGLANQKFTVPDTEIINESERIFVDEGAGKEEWTIVDTMIENLSCDKVCMVQNQADGSVDVFFGDNGTGKIPEPGSVIYATYRVGGGVIGNVGKNTITLIEEGITLNGIPLTIAVTNPEAATGGEDEQEIENARIEGPRSLRALYRAVTVEDFESLGEVIPGVAAVKAYASEWKDCNKSACCPVNMFLVPAGGGLPSNQLKQDVVDYFQPIKMACTVVEVFDPLYQPINITGNIVVYSNFNPEDVYNDVLDNIDAYFDADNSPYTGFDKGAYLSDILYTMDGVNGIDHVDLSEFTRSPYPHYEQWARQRFDPSNITEDYAQFDAWTIGEASLLEEWVVTFFNPTEFSVIGSVSGYKGNGVLGTEFSATDTTGKLLVSFTLLSGIIPNVPGDWARFSTSPKVANVDVTTGEFFTKGDVNLTVSVAGSGPQVRCV